MSRPFSDVAQDALKLSEAEQLKLARTLLERSEAVGFSGAEAAWEEEIERRIAMIDAGVAKGRPFVDLVREIDRVLGQ